MALLELRLREFLDEIAAEGRTPGGGSAAALVTAIAAGLLAKVARGSGDTWPEAAGIVAQAECLRDRATPLAGGRMRRPPRRRCRSPGPRTTSLSSRSRSPRAEIRRCAPMP